MSERAHVAGKPRQWTVALPATRGTDRSRTLIAKTCLRCGELQMADRFALTGANRVPNPTCRRCVALKRTKLPAQRSGRPLVAQTCLGCGRLEMAARFAVHPTRGTVETRCDQCVAVATSRWVADNPERHRQNTARADSRRNSESLGRALRHRQEWTGPELEIVLRDDLTSRQKAALLGRSYYAVKSALGRARNDPKWVAVAGATTGRRA